MEQEDTISAIATPPGAGAVGIVRLSGARAVAIAGAMFRARNGRPAEAQRSASVVYGEILAQDGTVLDEALLFVMRAPRSYTREDVVELQCHGGPAALRAVLARTFALGARPAERGEFTRRAFLNGRLDLSEAQAVMDIVGAKTEASLRMAAGRLAGRFSERIRSFRRMLLERIAHLEAAIDFPEDGVEEAAMADVRRDVDAILEAIEAMLRTAHRGRVLRDGLKTAIAGKPNVGKSSLLNALLCEERAIVTDVPGTTRDAIEAYADFSGVPVRLLDTAGIHAAEDAVERIGIERARAAVREASLVLVLFDGSAPKTEEDEEILSLAAGKDVVFLLTKSDRPRAAGAMDERTLRAAFPGAAALRISARTGEGLDALAEVVKKKALGAACTGDEASFVRDEREEEILRRASSALKGARQTIENGLSADFVVIDLRSAWETLGELTGETAGEDVIDEIFSRFCIGK